MWNKTLLISWIFIAFLSFDYTTAFAQTGLSDVVIETNEFQYFAKKAFDFPLTDSSFICSVELNFTSDSIPATYSTIMSIPVCDDGLCQTLELLMYWNLIGNYLKYDTIKGMPLTKYDHLPFTKSDYVKLHEILADNNSILERKTLYELFDRDHVRKSNTVDAITGATAQAVKNAIVEGALYSSYSLWHIANGGIKTMIQDYTKTIFTPELGEILLNSEDYQEQLFVLKLLSEEDFATLFNSITILLSTSNPLVEMYILKKLPEAIWQNQSYQYQLIRSFPKLNINSQSILFQKLLELDTIEISSLVFLSEQIDEMSINQLENYFRILENVHSEKNTEIRDKLKAASESMDDKAYFIDRFLNNQVHEK